MITFDDFIYSNTAQKKKINNKPSDISIINNIHKTLHFLNDLD